MTCVSRSIQISVQKNECIDGAIHKVAHVYPRPEGDLAGDLVKDVFLDDADYKYLLTLLKKEDAEESIVLIDRDYCNKRLNDRLVIQQMKQVLQSVCPFCLKKWVGS
jgi:hypothetical protein